MNKKSFKNLSFIITTMLLGSVLSGCGANSSGTTKSVTKGETVNLTLWDHNEPYSTADQKMIDLFNKKNPNIKITVENKGEQYDTLLNTAIQAGDAPDIFWSNGNKDNKLSSIVKIGGAMDLTDKIDLTKYNTNAQSILFLKDDAGKKKLYVTPGATIDTRVIYYHKDIFKKYGIKVPNTLEEFETACDTLLKNGVTPISLGEKTSWDILFTLEPIIAGLAPEWLDEAVAGKAKINDPRLLKALNKYEEWKKKGYFTKNGLGSDATAATLNFAKKNTAMIINGSWLVGDIKSSNPEVDLGAFQMPMVKGGKSMVVTYSVGWSGYAKTKHPAEVLKYLQFAASVEAQQVFVTSTGSIPGIEGIKANDQLTKDMGTADKQVDSFYSIIGYRPKEGSNPRKLWEDDSSKWVGGKITAQDLLKELDAAQDYSK